jgi:hypothetical protein
MLLLALLLAGAARAIL